MNGHSQFGEDLWILENLKPTPGIFCEVGAYDGVASSNTLLFEELGWKGICVEAVPELAARCSHNRKATTWCCAVGVKGFRPFYLYPDDPGRGGLSVIGKPIPMVVCELKDLISASGFDTINLLSIDTEGTELECFHSLGAHRPKIVIMEYRTGEFINDLQLVSTMTRFGYREVHRTFANLIFVHE